MRLDLYLVEKAFFDSRTKAGEAIKAKLVKVDGEYIVKPSFKVTDDSLVEVIEQSFYVSRSARKLKDFLPYLDLDVSGINCMDIGASTGGFTEVLLEEGAARVVAVDVGSKQLHEKIASNPKVVSVENQDIRTFESDERFELVVSDVSFIALENILDAVDKFATKWIILLFKPQFQVGKNVKRDKKGVVSDGKAIVNAQSAFELACKLRSWELVLKKEASVKGKEGNSEECYCFRKN